MNNPYCKCCKHYDKSRSNDVFYCRCAYLHKWVSPNQHCAYFCAGEYKKEKEKDDKHNDP